MSMAPERILPAQFMHLNKEMREYFGHMWKLPRTGVTEIRDQEVISDGHTYEDLKVITHELMNSYIGSEESFARAWEISCAKAWSELHPPIGIIKAAEDVDEVENEQDLRKIRKYGSKS